MIIDNSTVQTTAGDYPYNQNLSGVNNSNRALDINPEDIASVSVLKGGAAAALYGEKARDGVIIYTTKKGKARKGIGIDFSIQNEFNEVSQLPKTQSIYAQGLVDGSQLDQANWYNYTYVEPADPGPDGLFFTADDVTYGYAQSWGPLISSVSGLQSYDNANEFFRLGHGVNTDLAFYGGNEKGSYRVSLNHLDQQGMVPNTNLKRSSIRLSGETKLTDKFKIGGSSQFSITSGTKSQNGSNLAGIMLGLMRAPASFNLADWELPSGYQRNYYVIYDNPYYTAYKNPFEDEVKRLLTNTYLTYNQSQFLNATLRVGVDVWNDNRRQVFAISSFGNDNTDGKGQVNYNDVGFQNYYTDLIITGGIDVFKDVVKLNYNFGGSINSTFTSDHYLRGRELSVQGLYNLSNASDLYASNYETKQISRSVFGQLEFDVKDQLFVTLTGRNDWSSTNSEENRGLFYPSVSTSWLVNRTLSLPKWVDLLKLRYGWAQVGKSPTVYGTNTYYSSPTITDGFTNGISFPYNGVNGFGYSSSLGNSDLKPEISTENEIGLEVELLKRVSLTANYYRGTVKDLLINVPIAGSSGFTSQFSNGAELEFKGVELELGLNIVKSENLNWYVGLNWSKNENEVTKLANGVEEVSMESAFTSIGSYAIVGEPLGVFYGTKYVRDSGGNVIIDNDPTSSRYGLPEIDDTTGNIGNPQPDWIGGIRTNFEWKGIYASALLEIRRGGDIYNGTRARLNRFGRTLESAENRYGSYVVPGVYSDGTVNTIEISPNRYFTSYLGDGGGAAEQFVETVNWVRLRDVTIGYKMGELFKKMGLKFIQGAEVSVTGRNLWLDTNYTGVDPETSLTGAGSRIDGLDYFNNPGSKSYIVTLKFKF